jgi:ribosomal protein S18 acetylase RimI-like enzyme
VADLTRRPARPGDFAFFLDLARDALGPYVEPIWGWDEAVQLAFQRRWFAAGGVEVLELDGAPIGCLQVFVEDDHVLLSRIALLPEQQRRGLGTSLLREVTEDAAARGLPVRLSVLINNPARRLYERLGFRVVRIEEPRVFMEWRPTAVDESSRFRDRV